MKTKSKKDLLASQLATSARNEQFRRLVEICTDRANRGMRWYDSIARGIPNARTRKMLEKEGFKILEYTHRNTRERYVRISW